MGMTDSPQMLPCHSHCTPWVRLGPCSPPPLGDCGSRAVVPPHGMQLRGPVRRQTCAPWL